jgi:hypothetical protein
MKTGIALGVYFALAIAQVGCRVYDSELVNQGVLRSSAQTSDASVIIQPRTSTNSEDPSEADGGELTIAIASPRCGNGRVDDHEHCDIGIARGQVGACPDGCSGGAGCERRVMMGTDCSAQCVEIEISDVAPNDGCCPVGANAALDNDCTGTCGNAVVENGETCDPPESCPQESACTSADKCVTATYEGSLDQCNAKCELRPKGCASGDGCCPPGCSADRDDDCMPAPDAGVVDAMCLDPESGCTPSAGSSCVAQRAGADCGACDCAMCQQPTLDCLAGGAASEMGSCANIISCAATNHCVGLDCYCGHISFNQCLLNPGHGPCALPIFYAAGTSDVTQIYVQSMGPGAIALAFSALSCRQSSCATACGL